MNRYEKLYNRITRNPTPTAIGDFFTLPSLNTHLLRELCVKKYAWAIPSDEAIKEIAKYSPLLEIGAGSGYWAFLLQKQNVDIVCIDAQMGYTFKKNYVEVKKGTDRLIKNYTNRNLFLCWPNHSSSFAMRCLRNFFKSEAKYFIFVGEDWGGCTGGNDFFDLKHKKFELVNKIFIPQWDGIHDYVSIWRKK